MVSTGGTEGTEHQYGRSALEAMEYDFYNTNIRNVLSNKNNTSNVNDSRTNI